jgi:hypothetical protein
LAFAQPFLANKKNNAQKNELTAIYIDNSQSMSLRNGQRSMLDIAKEQAIHLIQSNGSQYLILSNDRPYSYKALSRQKTIEAINNLHFSPVSKTNTQVLTELQSMLQDNNNSGVDLYYFSDFQQNSFTSTPDASLLKNIRFNGVRIQQKNPQNRYIDTAFFESPIIQAGQSNKLIVKSKYFGETPKETTVLQLLVDGNVKSAATPIFNENKEHFDTLSFQINDAKWQKIILTLNDGQIHFDDTFSIAARSTPDLSVLLINEKQANPYIQAALRSYSGFKVTETNINSLPKELSNYNLILLNGLGNFDRNISSALLKSLQNGQNVCMFLGQNAQISAINEGLKNIADIQIKEIDTNAQSVSTVQSESRLVKDMFERIPENVQLPYTYNHYPISAGLSANQQSIFNFRNGDPFFALYSPYKGQLYICASSPEPKSCNFQSSYFFVPFLYQMASLAKGNNIFSVSAGQKQPIYINQGGTTEQNLLHINGMGLDAIPTQKAEGMGVQVFLGTTVQQPGFYTISNNRTDSTLVAVNINRNESNLNTWSQSELKKNWSGEQIFWQEANSEQNVLSTNEQSAFPLWKLCTILAVLMLGIETFLLSKNLLKQKTITT